VTDIEQLLAARYKINPNRDLSTPGRRFCRLDLTSVVESAKQSLLEIDGEGSDFATLPSWPKASYFPLKCKAFFSTFFKGIGEGVNRLEHLQLDWQLQQENLTPRHKFTCPKTGNQVLVEMMFFNTRSNPQLKDIGDIFRESNPNTHLIVLFGERINGTSFTNENAQRRVTRDIKKAAKAGKNVMIMASRLGQRSFSIPALSTVYLCYDNGGEAATRQKLARALTADTNDKTGWIISCSFDPKADDKLLPEQIATAQNLRKKQGGSFADNLKYVQRTDNIFDMTDNGLAVVDTDEWYNYAYEQGMITRVLGAMSNPYKANHQLRDLLLGATGWKPSSGVDSDTDTGETFNENKPARPRNTGNKTDEEIAAAEEAVAITKIREVLTLIVETFPRMQIGTGKRQVKEILEEIRDNPDHRDWFRKWFSMDVEALFMCIEQGVIDEESLEASIR
jgi:hypothetical protein